MQNMYENLKSRIHEPNFIYLDHLELTQVL